MNLELCTGNDRETFGGREAWEDETAWNYELGAKSRFLRGRGTFNVSAFYMDINNLQATVTAGTCSSRVIFNVPKARSVGAELEFAAAPTDHLDFALTIGLNNSELAPVTRPSPTAPSPSLSVSRRAAGCQRHSSNTATATYHGTRGPLAGICHGTSAHRVALPRWETGSVHGYQDHRYISGPTSGAPDAGRLHFNPGSPPTTPSAPPGVVIWAVGRGPLPQQPTARSPTWRWIGSAVARCVGYRRPAATFGIGPHRF